MITPEEFARSLTLRGAGAALENLTLVEAELSLLPVYHDAPLLPEVYGLLAANGFAPIAFEGVLDDESTGEMLQVDAIFSRLGTESSLVRTAGE